MGGPMGTDSRTTLIAAVLLAAATFAPTAAATINGFQVIETFDGLNSSWDGRIVDGVGLVTTLSGGSILTEGSTLDPRFQPASGLNVYAGRTIVAQLEDPFNYSYAAISARVTGLHDVQMTVYAYNHSLRIEAVYDVISTPAGNFVGSAYTPNALLEISTLPFGALLTRAVFRSDADFTIDDLAFGLPAVMPGIPEPTNWALLIVGLGAVGTQLRRRRHCGSKHNLIIAKPSHNSSRSFV